YPRDPGFGLPPVEPVAVPVGQGETLRDGRDVLFIGFGPIVMRALEAAAKARGDREIGLHAQRSAERFYARLGYAVHGEPFEEAGIPHIEMRRALG
ncbi:GNAT family N-acetyltransferase, partial [Variovorax beijingensis]|uniref:GNAT family N-acetyltransferase n=1 Tax=Variovorax beijingensis TaxID=2496117 RepID=UPI003F69D893